MYRPFLVYYLNVVSIHVLTIPSMLPECSRYVSTIPSILPECSRYVSTIPSPFNIFHTGPCVHLKGNIKLIKKISNHTKLEIQKNI